MRKITFFAGLRIFFVLGFLITNCDKHINTFSTDPHSSSGLALSKAKDRSLELINSPGVVGVGNGVDSDGKPAIIVLTERKSVPGIPGFIGKKRTVIKVTGKIYALRRKPPKPPKPDPDPPVDPTGRFDRPVPIGVSTGHTAVTAGTIGARVTDGNNVYALSNNHVYANENKASIGDAVLQPGTIDGGSEQTDMIGTLSNFVSINFSASNEVDAAIALTDVGTVGNATPGDGYGMPKSTTIAAEIGMTVQKYGRTTSLTNGKIEAVNASVYVTYTGGTALFINQILVSSKKPGFIRGGDSGSLLVTKKSKKQSSDKQPVGLLFAGDGQGKIGVANQIDLVLEEFDVIIDGEL